MARKLDLSKFRVSSALKNIIGRELITDDFIAVFELVKNSFDAHAKRVDIVFSNLESESPRLVIKDNGKGMSKDDLVDKWLFVAYSAKREGVEDYRDKIRSKRIHAGAKGIGRFSCDRLGSAVSIYTKKRGPAVYNCLDVDWDDFEQNSQDEFSDIPVKFRTRKKIPHNLRSGTVIEISGLREGWDRAKLLNLKHSLEKLINPNQDNDSENFAVYLTVEEEREADDQVPEEESYNKVNGEIKNFIFEKLEIKTTQILTTIPEDGSEIITRLVDRGQLIYEVKEDNSFKEYLSDIKIHLFVLNTSAKTVFTRAMGVQPVGFGSIFLFKNGFRIYPFGEENDNAFGLDRRKQQGSSRYLGTRDLIGRIEINDNDECFKETSSRDGGLIKNAAFYALKDYFYEFALRRLEKFAVGVIKWGNTGELLDADNISPSETKSRIFDIVKNLTTSKRVRDIQYDPKLLNVLENRSENSVATLLRNFEVIAEKSDNPRVAKEARRARKQLKMLQNAKEEAEKESDRSRAEAEKAESEVREAAERIKEAERESQKARAEAKQKTTQNLFLQSVMSQDLERVVSLHHHIGISAGTIEQHIKNLSRRINKDKNLDPKTVQIALERISYQVKKITSTVRFATKANFNLEATEMTDDLVAFVKEHAINVCADLIKATDNINVRFTQVKRGKFVVTFRPIEFSIVIDNLLNNSKKADARNVWISVVGIEKDSVEISVRDDGKGVPKSNIKKIFELGFTTTSGSGLGLYHVSQIVESMNGEIRLNPDYRDGAEFILRFTR